MADSVDTAASLSPAEGAEKPQPAAPADEAKKTEDPAPTNGAAPRDEETEAPADEAEAPPDEAEKPPDEEAEAPDEPQSVTELLEQLSRELSELGTSAAQLEAARNMPEVRRTARDVAGVLVLVLAALTAFAFVNVAAYVGLSTVVATWLAALVLAAIWIVIAGVLLFGLMGRARRWLLWIVLKEPPPAALDELERERDAAAEAVRNTLGQLGPTLAIQIAMAGMSNAGDVAETVVDVGGSMLEGSGEVIADLTADAPGGSVINQVWDVALVPGRFGIRVASTVLRRGRPAD